MKTGWISQAFRNEQGITILTVKFEDISQSEFDVICKSVPLPWVGVNISVLNKKKEAERS